MEDRGCGYWLAGARSACVNIGDSGKAATMSLVVLKRIQTWKVSIPYRTAN
jgi:hypothetical protein